MAAFDLFGTDGSPAQVVDTTPDEFRALRPDVAGKLIDFNRSPGFTGQNLDQFTGEISGNELDTLRFLQEQSTTLSPNQQSARDFLGSTVAGETNPFLQDAIDAATRPIINQFERQTLPSLKQGFSKLGQTVRPDEVTGRSSSPFTTAAAFAQGDFLNAIGDVSARLSSENFQQEQNRRITAAQDLSKLRTDDVNNLITNLQAQALPRLIEEVGLDRALKEFNDFQDNLLASLGLSAQTSVGPQVVIPAQDATPGLVESFGRSFVNSAGEGLATAAFAA